MKYIEKHLLSGEQIIYSTRLSYIAILSNSISLLILGIFLIIKFSNDPEYKGMDNVGVLIVLISLIMIVIHWFQIISSEFAVTDKRVLIKVGLFHRHSLELLLQKVEGIAIDQPFRGRLWRYGTVIITGTGGTKEKFKNIYNPFEFRKQVQDRIVKSPIVCKLASPI